MSQFRPQAVNAYVDPEIRGAILRAAPPLMVVVYGVVALLALGFLAVLGSTTAETYARGRGIVRGRDAAPVLRAPEAGRVTSVLVSEGDPVEVGQPLVRLTDSVELVALADGIVDEVRVYPGEHVQPGDTLVILAPAGPVLHAYLAMPERHRRAVDPGRTVKVHFDADSERQRDEVEATVLRVREGTELPAWAKAIAPEGTPAILVELELHTSNQDFAPRSGMLFDGHVALGRRRVMSLLFRPLAELLGE